MAAPIAHQTLCMCFLRVAVIQSRPFPSFCAQQHGTFSTSAHGKNKEDNGDGDVAKLLEKPTWSVRSLLSNNKPASQAAINADNDVSLGQLRHLLRLSALPCPSSPEEQAQKLDTLRTQLHFVRDVQNVNTTGLRPLQSIRDETSEGIKEQTITVKTLEQALLREESFGHNRRPRRRKRKIDTTGTEDWDVLGNVPRKAGKYVVVDGAEQ